MTPNLHKLALSAVIILGLTACTNPDGTPVQTRSADEIIDQEIYGDRGRPRSTIWDIFRGADAPDEIGSVNKYIWNASLEVLSFLPVQSVDPFTGVIVTGFGTPPGGGRAYRATVLIDDPALDARSLKLAIMTRSGAASVDTVRAVEDAILTRARQLRREDSRL
ncbi:DUF3576 domain-containing protein [Primorskyibacter sp. S187A]|uniref:DUF3576 domain-containing protein n=1 Tax=Primorskyibacter sp. S187A TaxID=3415130 RepID=UPI003C7D4B56